MIINGVLFSRTWSRLNILLEERKRSGYSTHQRQSNLVWIRNKHQSILKDRPLWLDLIIQGDNLNDISISHERFEWAYHYSRLMWSVETRSILNALLCGKKVYVRYRTTCRTVTMKEFFNPRIVKQWTKQWSSNKPRWFQEKISMRDDFVIVRNTDRFEGKMRVRKGWAEEQLEQGR